ncbi:tellurium resistance protein [Methylacidiphilum caldifontis]|uniref:TerC family protein n=1 Tax=Methylacidiphilum caldifontis TaxID=2795386 RepID=UPI001A8EED43|nr:tellurium resistance protein [Methylacidiphilum caldifontis]QSR89643.1 tellurium resistance protein [Methylacidiphilum caldifontis]
MDLFYILFFSILGIGLVSQIFNSFRSKVTVRFSFVRSLSWIFFCLLLGLWLGFTKGAEKAWSFLGVFWIEYLLSLDNLIVFHLIFELSKTDQNLRQKILNIGIISAIILRVLFIILGLSLASHWSLIYPLFGLFLFYGAYQLFKPEKAPSHHPFPKTRSTRLGPFVFDPQEKKKWLFLTKNKIVLGASALTLLTIESSDIVFAFDSVPASFALSSDPLVIIGGNICGVLGLRSLYFIVEKTAQKIISIRKLSAWLLILMGTELIAKLWIDIPPLYSFIGIMVCCIFYGIWEKGFFKKNTSN